MTDVPVRLTEQQYRDALDALGLSQPGAARFLDVNERTSRRWAEGDLEPPGSIAVIFALMIHFGVTPDQALDLARTTFTLASTGETQ
jgi:DNA-binding transcriptional regulator YiaG